uniref:PI3K/PI4K catalytic domain-containing protein n=1 Tax=Globisporangium ultimum (strain ATCC 200006 / CBS 805.95 / DAOM BR144) TaxID=431595 RepID=K3WEW2_GLOUD
MTTTDVCRGLVRIRQQRPCDQKQQLRQQLAFARDGRRPATATLLDARDCGATLLNEDEWYFCALSSVTHTIEWFTVATTDADDDDGDEERSESQRLAATVVSHFEALEETATPQQEPEEEADDRDSLIEFDGLKLDSDCSFYIEDRVNGFAYLCEVESESELSKWAQFIAEHGVQEKLSMSSSVSSDSDAPTSPLLRQSTRPLVRAQTSDLDADDAFGLLSLTKSVFSSTASDAAAAGSSVDGSNHCAPGVFTFNQIEIREEGSTARDDDESSRSSNDSALRFHPDQSLNMVYSSGPKSSTTPSRNQCLRCQKRIGSLFRSAKVCASCNHRFCRLHCNQYAIISSKPKPNGKQSHTKKLSLVCVDCLVRQKLLTSITELATYYAAVVEAGGISRLVRWKFFSQKPKLDLAAHVQAWELGPLSLLSAMFKYRQHPFMFVVVLAQLVKNVEYCIETMDFYWPQFLQWGFVHLADAPPSVQTHYLFFLAATARRSVHLAVKATWECIAAHWDVMTDGAFERGHFIIYMLFFVTQVSFGEARSVLHQLLFGMAPEHQMDELEAQFTKLFQVTREIYVTSMRDSPYFSWLLARTDEEIVASSSNVRQQLFKNCDFLDPFQSDLEQQQNALFARKSLDYGHLVDTKVNITNAPALHIFSDVMQLVRFLVDLTTYLKESTPVPSERKTKLPGLLMDMQHGQFIRPESYLPLVPVVSPLHRVVNVLTDEGTVFSTKARAPTLVFFEVIRSDICEAALRDCFRRNTNPHAQIAVRQRQPTNGSCKVYSQPAGEDSDARLGNTLLDVLNFLDANIVETYVADLVPTSPMEDHNGESISEDSEGLQLFKPASSNGSSPSSQQSAEEVVGVNVGPDDRINSAPDRVRWSSMAAKATANGPPPSSSPSHMKVCRYFGERFKQMKERIRTQSRFAQYPGWSVLPVIAKSFDDMRQEVFVLQGLKLCQLIFQKHNLNLWLRYYSIVCAGKDCGLLEVITDAQSLDALKKKAGANRSFLQIFQEACGRNPITGQIDPIKLEEARQNFIVSMAAYSLFSYVFLIKDRHNGNILLDTEGHIVHIDFGFVLGIAPGNTFSLETAPFKLTTDMVDVIGYPGSKGFDLYKQLVHQGLVALHLEAKQILSLVYLSSKDSNFPCFTGTSRAKIIRRLERRLCVGWTLSDVATTASRIVDKSYNHLGTKQYDWFQQLTNGIAP